MLVFLSACFRYSPSIEASDNLELTKGDKKNLDQYCRTLSSAYKKKPPISQLPEFLIEYGDCLAREDIRFSSTTRTPEEVYITAAQCGNVHAKERLQSMNVPIPEEVGRRPGESMWMSLSDESCGLRSEVTGLGYLVLAPIWIPGGLVLLSLALVGLPLCVIIAPFFNEGCM